MPCCSSNQCTNNAAQTPRKLTCPVNGQSYATLATQTVKHHLKHPWHHPNLDEHTFAFCADPACEVIYFDESGDTFTQADVRTPVGQKSEAPEALICYCFDVSRADAAKFPDAQDYVLAQTKAKQCACEIRNPSGKCCLKDFPKR